MNFFSPEKDKKYRLDHAGFRLDFSKPEVGKDLFEGSYRTKPMSAACFSWSQRRMGNAIE